MSITIPTVAVPSGAVGPTITLPDPIVGSGTPFVVGETQILGAVDSGNANKILAQRHTMPQSGRPTSLSFYVGAAVGQLRLSVYDATGANGGPGALKGYTDVFTAAAGWNTKLCVVSEPIPAGGVWLVYQPSSNDLRFRVGDGGELRWNVWPSLDPPPLFPSTSAGEPNHWSFYGTFIPASAPPPPPPPPPGTDLPPLWNASPPSGTCPPVQGQVVGRPGNYDYGGVLATTEWWDHFTGPAGPDGFDDRLWEKDTINQGGTQEYRTTNAFLDGSDHAVLEATRSGSGPIYSGRFTSRTKVNMQYGWVAGRIKFPNSTGGVGLANFPAFWLFYLERQVSSQLRGEVDIMEVFGDSLKYSCTIYCADPATTPALGNKVDVPASHGGNLADAYHTYWMMWEPDRIRIGVDDLLLGDWGPSQVPGNAWDSMRQPFYFNVNFAVAPDWLPAPKASDFPTRMLIDWIWYKPLNLL